MAEKKLVSRAAEGGAAQAKRKRWLARPRCMGWPGLAAPLGLMQGLGTSGDQIKDSVTAACGVSGRVVDEAGEARLDS